MPAVPKPFLTPQEYLSRERRAETKSEYLRGEMFAMSAAGREHNLIVGNVSRELGQQLRQRPCEVYQADMRVKVSPTGLYTYPDVTVACGEPQFEDAEVDTLLNPTVNDKKLLAGCLVMVMRIDAQALMVKRCHTDVANDHAPSSHPSHWTSFFWTSSTKS